MKSYITLVDVKCVKVTNSLRYHMSSSNSFKTRLNALLLIHQTVETALAFRLHFIHKSYSIIIKIHSLYAIFVR